MRVTARLNGAQTRCFTDGKVYEAYKEPGKEYCRTWVVKDDIGHERIILPDQLCPHLNRYWKNHFWPYEHQEAVGVFQSVKETT